MAYHPRDIRRHVNSAKKAKTAFIAAHQRAETSGDIDDVHESNRLRVDVEQAHEDLYVILHHPGAAADLLGIVQQLFDGVKAVLEVCPELEEPADEPANPAIDDDLPPNPALLEATPTLSSQDESHVSTDDDRSPNN